MITWSIPSAGTSVGSASLDPSTFSPLITAPCFRGSSSTNPRRSMSCSPRARISRTAITPAAPAPTSSTAGRAACRRSGPPAVERRLCSADRPARHPDAQQAAKRRQRVHDDDRDGNPQLLQRFRQEEPKPQEDRARARAGADERRHLGHPDVLPHERERPAEVERRKLDGQHQGQLKDSVVPVVERGRRTRTAAGRPARRPGPSPPGRIRRSCAGRRAEASCGTDPRVTALRVVRRRMSRSLHTAQGQELCRRDGHHVALSGVRYDTSRELETPVVSRRFVPLTRHRSRRRPSCGVSPAVRWRTQPSGGGDLAKR